jgi:hypothetical protein
MRFTPHRLGLVSALLMVALGALAADPPPKPDGTERPVFAGAAVVFSLDAATVVYPVDSDPERTALARRSAEHRAAFLRFHGLESSVSSDDAVTPEARAGNLLLLGWDNALLPDGAVTPASGGRRTLWTGLALEPTDDFLFAAPSPYAANRRIVFWSRIDPELDRQTPIPFLGSDWGVFQGHHVVNQGMFAAGRTWPPARETAAERFWGDRLAELPAGRSSAHYRLHVAPGSVEPAIVDAILAARENAYVRAVELVGDPGSEFRIELYVYPDRDVKREISGIVDPVHSVPRSRQLHMQVDRALSPHPHEEVHLVAGALWGPCFSSALYEGLALALTGLPGELERHAAILRELGEVPPIADLLDEADLLAWNERQLGLPSAGLLVRWMIDRGGLAAVGRMYGARPPLSRDVAASLSVAPGDLDKAFGDWVRSRGATAASDLELRRALEVAAHLGENGDWAGAADALEHALAAKPDDPEVLYSLGLMELRAGRSADCERHLRRLVNLDVRPEAERYVIFGHYQLGQLLAASRPAEARAAYEAMLALPDRHNSHQMARDGLEKLRP